MVWPVGHGRCVWMLAQDLPLCQRASYPGEELGLLAEAGDSHPLEDLRARTAQGVPGQDNARRGRRRDQLPGPAAASASSAIALASSSAVSRQPWACLAAAPAIWA